MLGLGVDDDDDDDDDDDNVMIIPIDVTLVGMVINVNDVQYWKAEASIYMNKG